MKLHEHLDDKTKRKLNYKPTNQVKKRRRRKCKEKLSERDILELMGCNRPTYERRRGAVRQK